MLLRLLTLSLALASSVTAFKPIPCGCDATLAVYEAKPQECRDSKWCGIECLRYLREDERIMDLVHCRESTVSVRGLVLHLYFADKGSVIWLLMMTSRSSKLGSGRAGRSRSRGG